tara:strand:- start:146 stop:430 length:285 start_codon:yes stop_codon:yes gene_type:complete
MFLLLVKEYGLIIDPNIKYNKEKQIEIIIIKFKKLLFSKPETHNIKSSSFFSNLININNKLRKKTNGNNRETILGKLYKEYKKYDFKEYPSSVI